MCCHIYVYFVVKLSFSVCLLGSLFSNFVAFSLYAWSRVVAFMFIFWINYVSIYVYLVHCCLILLPFFMFFFIYVLSRFVLIFCLSCFHVCLCGSLFLILFVAFSLYHSLGLDIFHFSFEGFIRIFWLLIFNFVLECWFNFSSFCLFLVFPCLCIIPFSFLKCSALFLLWLCMQPFFP